MKTISTTRTTRKRNLPLADYRTDSPNPALAERCAINQQRMAWLKRLQPSGTLLDIGCGQGHFLRTAGEHGYQASGIDVSESAIEYGVREFGVQAAVGTIESVFAAGIEYDLITMWHVLEHFVNPFETLKQSRGLLREGGFCFIEVPNLHSLKFMLAKQKWEGTNHPLYHRTFFSASTLGQACAIPTFRTQNGNRFLITSPAGILCMNPRNNF